MLGECREELICDLAETYHILDMWALPVSLLATLASGLREDSRVMMYFSKINYIPECTVLPQLYDFLRIALSDKKHRPREGEKMVDIMHKKKSIEPKAKGFTSGSEFDRWRSNILKVPVKEKPDG